MKNILLFAISLVLPLIATSQSQTINTEAIDEMRFKCIYSLSYQSDSTNAADVRKENMLLAIGNNCSRFISENHIKLDSIIYDMDKRGVPPVMALADISKFPKTNFKYQVFKNYPEGKLTFFDRIIKTEYKYEEVLNSLNWEIFSDTTSFAGMKCQKASTNYAGRNYIAWFTNEIPVSDGPYIFHGLPGLIVKIGDTKSHYVYELKSISKVNNEEDIYFPTDKTIDISRDGLLKANEKANRNIIQRLEQMGAKIIDPTQRKILTDRAKRKARQKNNPIELI